MARTSDHPPNSRLYVLCPQSITDADMPICRCRYFNPYGTIEDCFVLYDGNTKKSKGICYIKFSKASEACRAMEEMDPKQLGNEPRAIKVKMSCPVGVGHEYDDHECYERLRCAFIRVPDKPADDGNPYTEEKIKGEFSKFGTVVNCHMTKSGLNCLVKFEKPSQAAAAIEQCDKDFSAVFVDPPGPNPCPYVKASDLAKPGQGNGNAKSAESSLLSTLVDTLSAAASSSSSATGRMAQGGRYECSVKLSSPKARLPTATPYKARLFIRCSIPVPNEVLEDAFSTFGDLINVYMLSGKNCGYVKYGSRASADAAMATMDNATLNGAKLQILLADPEPAYKRQRTGAAEHA